MTDPAAAPPEPSEDNADEGIAWRAFFDEARDRLTAAGCEFAEIDARRIVEEAAGIEPHEFAATLEVPALKRGVAHFDAMLVRRLGGEPLQYVLGRWAFRSLDLAVDARVLIPRPETEIVAGLVLDELRRLDDQVGGRQLLAADLGTGSGCIGLSLVAEFVNVHVICTDQSDGALSMARANAVGLGRPASRVEMRAGSWFDALDLDQRAMFDVIVSNPPYIGIGEVLPAVVADWEPVSALRSGDTGFDAAAEIINGAPSWLRPHGVLVLELGETQLDRARQAALAAGFVDVEVHQDFADRDRALVARLSPS